ncbi:esterase, partial [Streptomyces sp. NPDC004533]
MGLTSNKVLVLALVLAVLLFVGTVWYWPTLARRNWQAVGGRVGLLFATQLTVIAALGLAANQTFGFYASWSDLLGEENGQGVVVDNGAAGSSGGPLQVLGTQTVNVSGGARPQIGGQIQRVTIFGPKTHIATPAYVYLPPEYFQPAFRTRS